MMTATRQSAYTSEHVAAALLDEARLLVQLGDAFRRQRAAVAADDAQAIDDSVFAATRIMHTVGEARQRRRAVVARVLGTDVELSSIPSVLGNVLPAALRAALDELHHVAEGVAEEVRINRGVLTAALAAGDVRIRALCGAGAGEGHYDANAGVVPVARSAGTLLNRQV